MSKFMLSFTKSGTGTFTKLRIINEIKSYVTYLIANSSAEIYFFSNIEIGSKLENPHLHTQIWCDDKIAVRAIYDKVITKFYLDKSFCKLSKPQQPHKFYNYLIKEYSASLTDDEIWNIETAKRDMRRTLGLKIRFYSKSKSKYTSKLYRMVYHVFGVLRAGADKFLDFFINVLFVKRSEREAILGGKKGFCFVSVSSFISIKNKMLFQIQNFGFVNFSTILLGVLFYSPSNSPPFLFTCLLCVLSYLVGVIMCWLCLLSLAFGFY